MMLQNFAGLQNTCSRLGSNPRLACPACGQDAPFTLFQVSGKLNVLGIDTLSLKDSYFTACPLCGAAFSVKPSAARLVSRWPDFPLRPEYLILAQPSVKWEK